MHFSHIHYSGVKKPGEFSGEERRVELNSFNISFMENNDLHESAKVLSLSMLNNPLHIAVFQGNSENVRFYEKFGFKIISKSKTFHVENRYMERVSQT